MKQKFVDMLCYIGIVALVYLPIVFIHRYLGVQPNWLTILTFWAGMRAYELYNWSRKAGD